MYENRSCWTSPHGMRDMLIKRIVGYAKDCIESQVVAVLEDGLQLGRLSPVEALACGANVVGSDVGGICEAIGKENVYSHGNSFIEDISDRIVQMLSSNVDQPLLKQFEWETTATKELKIYNKLLSEN